MLTLDTATEATARRLRHAPPVVRTPVQAGCRYARLALGLCGRRAAAAGRALRAWWLRVRGEPRLRDARRLCLGSGRAPIPDWTNIDLDGSPDVRLDLRYGLPLPNRSVDFIYSEHMIEHVPCEDGLRLLRECRRVLRDDGVLRIATPDLEALLDAYRDDWRDQDWVHWPGHEWIDSATRMLNQAFHGWGHQYLYDADELERRLRQVGFGDVRRCQIGESGHLELRGLETRLDSKLILEARGTNQENHA